MSNLMVVTNNNSTLTEEEEIVIDIFIEGCIKLICKISGKDPLKYAIARSHHQTKSLTYTSAYFDIPKIIEDNPKIRPFYIKKRLPENLQNIQDADLSRILKSYININMLSEAEEDDNRRRPGHPSQNENNDKSISGPKSFYEHSSYQKILENVLAKPEARRMIYNYLLESELLYIFYVSEGMTAYYIEKKNDKEAAWNIIQACKPPNMISQSDFEECFDTQNQELYQVNKNKIKRKSRIMGKIFYKSP